ncbi:DUF6458 family protein [Pilimelia columellifera]|uniref:DUF6458 domain-containing protein n=1 Tax=Pilimelia columellifera subsp. columellifera TaxID=706583 RepID=A0ABN3N5E9_9ACTN
MGIGGGIFLIASGAILAYAIDVDLEVLDLKTTGWILILAGVLVEFLTIWYLVSRRRRQPRAASATSVLEETRLAHGHAMVDPEPVETHVRPPREP